jgi:hypothetical protein
MSNKVMELNKIQRLLRDLAFSHGLTDEDLNSYDEVSDDFEWHIDWKQGLSESLDKRMKLLTAAVALYEAAMSQGDALTAKAALIHAGVQLQTLSGFFDGVTHDVKKAYSDPRFNWPEFPDGWKIPPNYRFKE